MTTSAVSPSLDLLDTTTDGSEQNSMAWMTSVTYRYTSELSTIWMSAMMDVSTTPDPSSSNSTVASNLTDNVPTDPWEGELEYQVIQAIDTYFPPLLLIAAVVGNGLSFVVFSTKEFRSTLTALLFMILAVADTSAVFIYDGLHSIPAIMGNSVFTISNFTCKFCTFFYFFTRSLSAMILVVICLERFIGIWMPHRARVYNTKRNFLALIFISTIFILANYAPLLSSMGLFQLIVEGTVVAAGCSTTEGNPDLFWYGTEFFPWANLLLNAILPFTLILLFNCGIIYKLIASRKMRSAATSSRNQGGPSKGPSDNTMATVYMLLGVSFVFILLNIPYAVYFFLERSFNQEYDSPAYLHVLLLGTIASLCTSLNHCINIFMYCICGLKFRRTLVDLICCRCTNESRQLRQKNTISGATSSTQLRTVTSSVAMSPATNSTSI